MPLPPEVNEERLARVFTELCQIESPSRQEGKVSRYLQECFQQLGADTILIDDSGKVTGSETGNLLIRFHGTNRDEEAIFFACHMDTVGPTDGIEVIREGDTFRSAGETILGADDKSGIAALVELCTLLREKGTPHIPFEMLFTTCEEIGLLGAKAMDPSFLQATSGYALDSTRKDTIIKGAPAANRLKITISGKAAHSGFSPESGIDALAIAARCINNLTLGRLDSISTANFGLIRGGTATNIVPESVVIEGEVRSHDPLLLEQHTDRIKNVFHDTVGNWAKNNGGGKPSVIIDVQEDFPRLSLADNEPVLERLRLAGAAVDRQLSFDIAGGGSDANIFCGSGLKTAIVPTGMSNVHTTEEYVHLEDMVQLTELLQALVTPKNGA